jgi:hypothetical protein
MARERRIQGDHEFRDLVEWAKTLGFTCERKKKSGHYVFRRPNTMPVFAASTASCARARLNNRRDLKHAIAESEQRQREREAQ